MSADENPHSKYLRPLLAVSVVVIAALIVALVLQDQTVSNTREALASAQAQVGQARSELQSAQSELAAAQADLTVMQSDLKSASEHAEALKSVVSTLEASYAEHAGENGYTVRNPTYDEVMAFLAADDTNTHPYNTYEYNCSDFSAALKNAAARQGIRCAYVNIYFPRYVGHNIVAFDTTDRGLLFIEPQADAVVRLTVGEPYHESIESTGDFSYPEPNYDDTVVRFTLVW